MRIATVEISLLCVPADRYRFGCRVGHFPADSGVLPTRSAQGEPVSLSQDPLFEFDCYRNPLREELPTFPIRLGNGAGPVPSGPGLGISIDEKVFARYRVA